jgi:hypothetical protein
MLFASQIELGSFLFPTDAVGWTVIDSIPDILLWVFLELHDLYISHDLVAFKHFGTNLHTAVTLNARAQVNYWNLRHRPQPSS